MILTNLNLFQIKMVSYQCIWIDKFCVSTINLFNLFFYDVYYWRKDIFAANWLFLWRKCVFFPLVIDQFLANLTFLWWICLFFFFALIDDDFNHVISFATQVGIFQWIYDSFLTSLKICYHCEQKNVCLYTRSCWELSHDYHKTLNN